MRTVNRQPGHEVVVVTGASSGVGRAIAHAFAKRRAHIGLLARGQEGLDATASEVEALGGAAIAIPADVADAEQVEAAAAAVEARFGGIDVWVNDAMATVFAPFTEITAEEFARATQVTYLGTVYGTMAALKRMVPRNRGAVVQVGSALSYRAIPLQSAYCGGKFAVRGFTDSVRTELLHNHSRVWISMVQLPAVNTPQFDWARSRLPRKLEPVPPIYQPEAIARHVFRAAHDAPREMWIGASAWKAIIGNMLIPGWIDGYLYYSGRVDTTLSFEELRRRSLINEAAQAADGAPDFSQLIRASLPTIRH